MHRFYSSYGTQCPGPYLSLKHLCAFIFPGQLGNMWAYQLVWIQTTPSLTWRYQAIFSHNLVLLACLQSNLYCILLVH